MKTRIATVDARCTSNFCTHNGDYRLNGNCYNCGSQVLGTFSRGHEAGSRSLGPNCPVCGCRRLYWGPLA